MSGSKLSDASATGVAPDPSGAGDQPLGLTVHSMPTLQEAVGADVQRTVRGRWKMIAVTLDGKRVNLRELKGQWLLVSVAGGACDAACQNHLYLQRQVRESLGKEKERLDWVWLVNDDAPIAAPLLPALKGATVLRVPPAQLAQWLAPAAGQPLPAHLYVVDPMGNWMMRFPPGLDKAGAARAKRDLDRLLRASSSWDQAGR